MQFQHVDLQTIAAGVCQR